jgi:hypothetical protein
VTPERLTTYERLALRALYDWKHPTVTWKSRFGDRLELTIEQIVSRLPTKLIDELFERALPILNRAANLTAPEALVLAAYRRRGHAQVRSRDDIEALNLEEVERVVGTKRFREVVKGAGEGAVAGFYGAPGAVADVPVLLGLALRTVNVFAYSYGFDPTTKEERAYALSVIAASAALGTKSKQLTRAALAFGERVASKEIAQKVLARLPRKLIVRLTAMSTSKAVPIAGAATGAIFNAWFLQRVAVHARLAYQQRFLERRHGPELLKAYGL